MKKSCIICGNLIPGRIIIHGKERNLQSRKTCLDCVPFKSKATGTLKQRNRKEYFKQLSKQYTENGINKAHIRRTEIRYRLIELLGGKCIICNYNKRPEALCFHHVETKSFNISTRECSLYPTDELIKEAKKCIILCHNCHTEHHAGLYHDKIQQAYNIQKPKLENITTKEQLPPLRYYNNSALYRQCKETGIIKPLIEYPIIISPPKIPSHYSTIYKPQLKQILPNINVLSLDQDHRLLHPQPGQLYIYEDELYKLPIIESTALSKNNKLYSEYRLRPKQCEIKLITNEEANNIYNNCHYLGGIHSKYHIGIYYMGILIAAMSLRKPVRQTINAELEISRMARDSNYFVYGLWSHVLKWAIKSLNIVGRIITFSDNRLSNGDVYAKIGFTYDGEVAPDYFWVKDGQRHNKSGLRKPPGTTITETELRTREGYHKVFDLGKKRWIYTKHIKSEVRTVVL